MNKKDSLEKKQVEINNPLKSCMPSFFAYNNIDKNMSFIFNGTSYDCRSKAQFKPYTFARMVSGLNHMLSYYYDTDPDGAYTKICSNILRYITRVHNVSLDLSRKDAVSLADRIVAIKEATVVDVDFCTYIVKYVDAVSDNKIDESTSTTDLSLNNQIANIIAVVSVVIKFNYLLSGLLRGSIVYDKSVEFTIDKIIDRSLKAVIIFYKLDVDEETLFNQLDSYIYNSGLKIFNDSAKSYYKSKFETLGKDSIKVATARRVTIVASLRGYFPKLRDEETAKKYLTDDVKDNTSVIEKEMNERYFNSIEYNWRDFTFNTLNMAVYFRETLKRIIKSQDLSAPLPGLNNISFLQDANDDSKATTSSQFDDKKRHLYNLRRDTMEYVAKDFITELSAIPDHSFLTTIKKFKCSKQHAFNTFVCYKILLCLTGEAKTYYKVLGIYNKLLLALFYYRIKYNPNMIMFHDLVEIMKMNPTDIPSLSSEQMEIYLESNGLTEEKYKKASSLFVIYNLGNDQRVIDPSVFCSFMGLIENPDKLFNLLFPNNKYNTSEVIKKYENVVVNPAANTTEEVKKKVINYMMNKKMV